MKKNVRFCIASLILLMSIATPSVARDYTYAANRYITPSRMHIYVGSGAHMYIGSEESSSARFNSVMPNFVAEWGYNLTAEIALSLNFTFFPSKIQTRYGRHPFVDFTGVPTHIDAHDGISYPEYQEATIFAGTLTGLVSLDWTNIIIGYDYRRAPFHVSTPIGMGVAFATGKNVNPRTTDYSKMPFNKEFIFTGAIQFDYQFNNSIGMFLTPRILITRHSFSSFSDPSDRASIFDMIPMVNVGVKIALQKKISWITK